MIELKHSTISNTIRFYCNEAPPYQAALIERVEKIQENLDQVNRDLDLIYTHVIVRVKFDVDQEGFPFLIEQIEGSNDTAAELAIRNALKEDNELVL